MDRQLKHIVLTIMVTAILASCSQLGKKNYSQRTSRKTNSFDMVFVSNIKKKRQARKIENISKLAVKSESAWNPLDLFRSEQKELEVRCPSEVKKRKRAHNGKPKPSAYEVASVISEGAHIRATYTAINFDIIELEEYRLDVPAFKQFKNNMTDFTADGEAQFQQILGKIRTYLGENTDGEGVTLSIIGSASQIPTSFDPEKPNNNIRSDGSSRPGHTSIENNRKLAQARATQLAHKIQEVFENIEIEIPKLQDIKIGETTWDKDAQDRLNDAFLRGDKAAMQRVYEPFQKDQFVQVESKETQMRTIKPNALKMHMVSTMPRLVYKKDNLQEIIAGKLIVSKVTYDIIGSKRAFPIAADRDAFLREHGLETYRHLQEGQIRYYLLTKEEHRLLKIKDDYDRIYAMYESDIISRHDKSMLEKIITEKYLKLSDTF